MDNLQSNARRLRRHLMHGIQKAHAVRPARDTKKPRLILPEKRRESIHIEHVAVIHKSILQS
jgi:hypothetical protein